MIQNDWNNTCEIYDPAANTWTTFASPTTPNPNSVVWAEIGDAPCAVLPDGTFLIGSVSDANVAKLDPSTLSWTAMNQRIDVGSGVSLSSDEDSWVLMPDNTVVGPSCMAAPSPLTWVYRVATNQWILIDPPST